jgi:predicted ribonuclease toxin of YeeF-YezG toxin-antitoxin module
LVARLNKEFQKHVTIYKPSPQVNRNNTTSKVAKDILSEGR